MGTEKKEKKEKKVVEIKVDDILPNRFQPRIKFDESSINELSESIKEHGVIQPLVVRKIGDKYEIIAGERRYKASVMAGLETVPAIVTDLNDKDSAEVALIENVQRQNLTPIEEAVSYKKILDMGYLTQEQLALKLGKSQSSIANKLRLLNLDDDVQEALLNGQISERHARSLLKLSSNKQQVKMLNRIIDERLTVRRTDEEIDKMLNELFEADDEETSSEGSQKELEPVEKEDEIEHTQPLSFDFSTVQEGPKENLFDAQSENNENPFFQPQIDETNFFGFNQDIMSQNENGLNTVSNRETIKDEFNSNFNDFVDVNKIEQEAQDLYPKEETKDINSFLEPTLLVDDDINIDVSKNEQPTDNIENNSIETKNNVMPIDEDNGIELDNEMKPGKFFNLFNDDMTFEDSENGQEDRKIEEPSFETNNAFSFQDSSKDAFNENELDHDYNRIDENENNFNYDNQNNSQFQMDNELTEVVPQSLEAEEVQSIPNEQTTESSNINLALEKIRNYAEELKKLGIDMNIEESDFENKYQITINIDK